MSTKPSTLSLAKRDRTCYGSASQTKRTFLDFVVDGISLYERFGPDLISTLLVDPPVPSEQEHAIRRLLGMEQGDLPSGRVSLYICAECGDLGCGAISLKIDLAKDEIIWSDFGYENNYEETIRREYYRSIGPFRFDRPGYEALFDLNVS